MALLVGLEFPEILPVGKGKVSIGSAEPALTLVVLMFFCELIAPRDFDLKFTRLELAKLKVEGLLKTFGGFAGSEVVVTVKSAEDACLFLRNFSLIFLV